VRIIKRRTIRWAGHVAGNTKNRNPTVLKRKTLKETNNLEDLDVDGKITLKWFVKK
jgi:hypothetical protein